MRSDIANTPDISINQLEEVFASFNRVSAELGSSYRELEARVSGLSEELAATHSARIKELTQKEMLAAKLSALMDALPGGVITLDASGTIKEENPVAIQILGGSFQGEAWLQTFEKSASIGSTPNGEVTFQSGDRISISSSAYGDEGETIILLTDVSESYRLNNLINREKRLAALGEMAARLAHQLRTPLSSAILYLSHIPTTTTKRKENPAVTQKIRDCLRQIERLIEGMLSYIRGGTQSNQEFCLNDLLREVEEATYLQITTAEGELNLNLPTRKCRINGDQEALFNALTNLVENSIQAVNNKPVITISLKKENKFYRISVEDNGPGIDDAIKEQVFDPFFSTRPMGTGLGLAVVLSTAKAHNGEVFINTAKSGGTIVQLLIPDDNPGSTEKSGIWRTTSEPAFDRKPKRISSDDPDQLINNKQVAS